MLEESGVVVAVDGQQAWVQTIRKSACSSCEAKNSCGQSVLSRISDGKANQVLVNNTLNLKTGDEVLLGIPEDMLVKASIVVYLLPLVVMIVVASGVEKWLSPGDGWIAFSGGIGLALGFLLVRLYSHYHSSDQRFCPKMIKSTGSPSIPSIDITTQADA